MTKGSRAPLMVLGAAIAATAGNAAEAAPTLVSTAGAGFTPVTIGAGAGAVSSYSFDLDGNGTLDFSITSAPYNPVLNELRSDTGAGSFGGLSVSASPSALSLANVKHDQSPSIYASGAAGSNYAALATNFVPTIPNGVGGTGTLGYLQGDYTAATAGAAASFRLLDFGLVSSAVPEPESWAMMIVGVGAVGALRRRQKRQEATSLAAC